jgi:rhodanese-related sulfurtransferase
MDNPQFHQKSNPSLHYGGFLPSAASSAALTPTPLPDGEGFIRISLSGAKSRFDSKSSIFLDARPPEEYKEGHIPGALSFYAEDFDQVAPQILPKLTDKNKELIAYCHGSSCELSIVLAHRLSDLGYSNVKVFYGGWPQWKSAGYPLQTGENP